MPKIGEELRGERRGAILRAAMASLVAHGYAGTSMRTIAEAAGMTKGALYAYYADKDALLLAVAESYLFGYAAEALAPREGVPAGRRLRELFAGYRGSVADPETVSDMRAFLDLWIALSEMPDPAVREAIGRRYGRIRASLAELVRRAQEEGAVRPDVDPVDAAGLVLAARDGMLFQGVKLGAGVPVPRLTGLLERLLFRAAPPP